MTLSAVRLAPNHQVELPGREEAGEEAQRSFLAGWLGLQATDIEQLSGKSVIALACAVRFGIVASEMVETQRATVEDLQKAANTDALTNVGNRRWIYQLLEMEWRRTQRYGRPFSVLMVDIDDLKVINDSFGHPIGDFVIETIARVMSLGLRTEDRMGRVGGDEFLILCPETDIASAIQLASKMSQSVAANSLREDIGLTAVHVSIGWASTTEMPETTMGLIEAADARLYECKRARLTGIRSPGHGAGAQHRTASAG